jgi:holo-[acyl-carrier protein] synthase
MRIGCDLVSLPRFERSLQVGGFIARIFHEHEIVYCNSRPSPVASFAARFAAKEAFVKALGTGLFGEGISPHDVWIEITDFIKEGTSGRPRLCWNPHVNEVLERFGIKGADVSLSHHEGYAMAVVILF